MKDIIIVAALSENYVIGLDGKIPWHFPEDLKRFKEITLGGSVVMGRKTFESIGHPLVGRENIILSKQERYFSPGTLRAKNLSHACCMASNSNVYIIGGESVYKNAIPRASRMELTFVNGIYEGDRFFPEINEKDWEITNRDIRDDFSFISYRRSKW